MAIDLFSSCPVCEHAPLAAVGKRYQCAHCGLIVKPKRLLGFKSHDQYVVKNIGSAYGLAKPGIVGRTVHLNELKKCKECVYSDEELAQVAQGNIDVLHPPSSTLAQILLEQLRETCYLEVDGLRRAHGPVLEEKGDRFPKGLAPVGGMTWKDKGNLFLTNSRLVFPSNTFTFIRMDRKLVSLKTFENGIAIQRKGEDFATYFVGCRAHQAAWIAAYIQGKLPSLRKSE